MHQKILHLALLLIISWSAKAQDPVYSQFYASPLQLNPAFAGNNFDGRVVVNYRLQWPGISAAYNTFAVSFDQYYKDSKLALGISLLSDNAGQGAITANKVGGVIGYRLKINEGTYIKGGLELGFAQRRLAWDRLIFYDAIAANGGLTPGGGSIPSKEIEPSGSNRAYFDIGTGLLLYNNKFFLGIAGDHLNTPNDEFLSEVRQNYIGLPIRWSIHGGYQIDLPTRPRNVLQNFATPYLLYARQANFGQLHFGTQLGYEAFMGGLGYRVAGVTGDAVIINLGIRTERMRVGYSFDYTTSGLTLNQGGSHEINFGYLFGNPNKESKLNDCINLFN